MKFFEKSPEEVIVAPQNDRRCARCGGYEGCDEDAQNRYERMIAEQSMPQASYPTLPCPCCQEVH